LYSFIEIIDLGDKPAETLFMRAKERDKREKERERESQRRSACIDEFARWKFEPARAG